MEYDKDKVDELVLALLYLTTHEQGTRAKKAISATQRARPSQYY